MNPNRNVTKLFLVGLRGYDNSVKQRIILANVIFLVVPVIIVLSYLMDYDEYVKPIDELKFDQFTRLKFAGASLACYLINRKGYFEISRWVYIFSWIAFWLVLDPVVQGTSSDYYFHFDLSIIGLSIICQILFSMRTEPIIFFGLMSISAIFIVLQQQYLMHFDANQTTKDILIENQYTYFTSIYYWAIFNLIIGYLIFVYEDSNAQLADNNEQLDRLTSNLEDIVTERTIDLRFKQKELEAIAEKLIESEQKYRTLFTNSFEGIARLELKEAMKTSMPVQDQLSYLVENLVIDDCNDQFANIYQRKSAQELIGEPFSSCLQDEKSLKSLLFAFLDGNYHIDGQVLEEDILGDHRWFTYYISSSIVEDKLRWIWLNKLDITEKAIRDVERKKLLEALEEYAFQTSHQLRGPLSRLLGLTDLLLNEQAFTPEELPDILRHINYTSKEIDEVIRVMNDVLSQSSYESKLTKKE